MSKLPRTVMILAAGRGERMRPLTDHCPKPLLPVAGKPLLAWHLDRLAASGVSKVVINVAHLGEQIKSFVGDGSQWGLQIRISCEAQALETAGGIAQAWPWDGTDPVGVINGDVWCETGLDSMAQAWMRWQACTDPPAAWILLTQNPDHHPNGDFGCENGFARLSAPRFTYTGMGLYPPQLFLGLQRGSKAPLGPLLRAAAHRLELWADVHPQDDWIDVGTPERLAVLEARLRAE